MSEQTISTGWQCPLCKTDHEASATKCDCHEGYTFNEFRRTFFPNITDKEWEKFDRRCNDDYLPKTTA